MSKHVQIKDTGNIEELLEQLPIDMRNKALRKAVNAGGRVVRNEYKRQVPVGDKSHKPHLPALKDSIGMRVKEYSGGIRIIAVVGGKWPDGAHAHLIEDGWNIRARGSQGSGPGQWTGAKVEGKRPLARAIDLTQGKVEQEVVKSLQKSIKQAGG